MNDVFSLSNGLPSGNTCSVSVDRPVISREQARAAGAKRYFTGKACRHGHLDERYVCKGVCVVCNDAQVKRWSSENPQGRYTIKSKWRNANIDRAHAVEAAWRARNVERRRAKEAKRAAENKESILEAARAYRAANGAACRARVKDWFRRNPSKTRLYNATRRGLSRNAEGTFTSEDTCAIRRRQRDRCAYCRTLLNGGGSLDHILALAKGGSNWPRNLQWVCESCNSAKCDRDAIEFAQRKGLLL